ncbi:hypothetical protein V6N12_016877 [Hibiscus sabdariffa]|uniref:Uncharacterized protein n=1 Tax=Hibiscus sabdariffa TaxID=183260 RepID=A0ABR2BQ51_9ROSI
MGGSRMGLAASIGGCGNERWSLRVVLLMMMDEGGARGVEGFCHDDVRWWVRWFNGGCRMKVVKWNDGFVMKMKGIRG